MLNTQPDTTGGNNTCGPSGSQISTSSQHLRSKNSQNGKTNKSQPIQNNTVNLTRSSSEVTTVPLNNPTTQDGRVKNPKQLHVVTQTKNHPGPHTAPIPISAGVNPSVHNFFMNQSNVAYTQANSRYLENAYHHPQYQYMQQVQNTINMQQAFQTMAIQNNQYSVSAPTTPLLNMQNQNSSYMSSPQTHPSNLQFIQNMMQHPLLNHTLNSSNHVPASGHMQSMPGKKSKKSPKKTKNNKDVPQTKQKSNEKYKFEDHWPRENVEEGLKNGTLFEGVLRINPKQFQQGFISSSDRDEQDIFIDGIRNRNRALEGDVVVVQLIENDILVSESKNDNDLKANRSQSDDEINLSVEDEPDLNIELKTESETEIVSEIDDADKDEEKKQRKGKVVFILEKVHTRTCIGSLKHMPDKNKYRALFVPRDHRMPRLNIPFTCWPDNFYKEAKSYENTLFLAVLVDWFDIRFAVGKLVNIIGQAGDMRAESIAILAENDLDVTPFGPEVRHLFPRLDYTIAEEEIKRREDCRKLCVYSIDPSNCRDIDDALSCRELENGNFEIGVHISDVSHYLTEDTELDLKVASKATTIYMVERAYHMLPDELCMLCSLFPGTDKLAFSVFWEITKDAQVLSHRFSKTIIHSCAQLAYSHAQSVLENNQNKENDFPEIYSGFTFKEIQQSIQTIGAIAALFRQRRFEGGALKIDQPKAYFQLNPTSGLPDSYHIHESQDSHQMIEEFMLLANMTVARRVYEDHPQLAFLRCHPQPSGYMLRNLAKALKPMGIELEISSAGDLHRSLLPYVGSEGVDRGRAMVLSMLCAKPMTRAKYFCAAGCDDDDFPHYALNVPLYTHFTSPIRRYADIMVHRLLAASLKYRETPNWAIDNVRQIAAQCNKQKYNAKRAGEMSVEMYLLKYIELNSPITTEAVVADIKLKHIDVVIIDMGLNRKIFLNNNFSGEYKYVPSDESSKMSKMELKWRADESQPEVSQVIEVFSIIKVLLIKEENKIETRLVRPIN